MIEMDMESVILLQCFSNKEYFSKVFSHLNSSHFSSVGNNVILSEMKHNTLDISMKLLWIRIDS